MWIDNVLRPRFSDGEVKFRDPDGYWEAVQPSETAATLAIAAHVASRGFITETALQSVDAPIQVHDIVRTSLAITPEQPPADHTALAVDSAAPQMVSMSASVSSATVVPSSTRMTPSVTGTFYPSASAELLLRFQRTSERQQWGPHPSIPTLQGALSAIRATQRKGPRQACVPTKRLATPTEELPSTEQPTKKGRN